MGAVRNTREAIINGFEERHLRDLNRLCKLLVDALKNPAKMKAELNKCNASASVLKNSKPTPEVIGLVKVANGSEVIEWYKKARETSINALDVLYKVTVQVTDDGVSLEAWDAAAVEGFKKLAANPTLQILEHFKQLKMTVLRNIRTKAITMFKPMGSAAPVCPPWPWWLVLRKALSQCFKRLCERACERLCGLTKIANGFTSALANHIAHGFTHALANRNANGFANVFAGGLKTVLRMALRTVLRTALRTGFVNKFLVTAGRTGVVRVVQGAHGGTCWPPAACCLR